MTFEKICFVIAPIGGPDSETRKRSDQVLKHVIRPAAESCGYKAVRADEIDKPGLITSQVIQHVVSAPLVVADLTGVNPNVFYELAIRHALRKPLVQLIQKGDPIPFDVAATRTIYIDHKDLDSAESARNQIIDQIRVLENDPLGIETPISVSLDLQILRQSATPEARVLADLVNAVVDMKASLSKLELRIGTNDQQGVFSEMKRLRDLLQPAADSVIPTSSGAEGEKKTASLRAVLNPAIFEYLGKKMRIAFLHASDYASLAKRLEGIGFEALAVLGKHDLIFTDVNENLYDMIYDITQVVSVSTDSGDIISPPGRASGPEKFPYFRVDSYFKVLGVPVGPREQSIFDNSEHPAPTESDLAQISALCTDWHDVAVDEGTRMRFLSRRWILAYTGERTGEISAVMSISMKFAEAQQAFEDLVIPALVARPECTSIYGGRAEGLSMNYVIRVTGAVASVLELIDHVHGLSRDARAVVTTDTYVAVRKMAGLSLTRALLLPPGREGPAKESEEVR